MTVEKSRGQALDEVAAELRSGVLLKAISDILASAATRTGRKAKGIAYDVCDTDDDAEDLLAMAERSKDSDAVAELARRLLVDKLDAAVESVLGQSLTALRQAVQTAAQPAAPSAPIAPSAPVAVSTPTPDGPTREQRDAGDGEWFTDEERRIMGSRRGQHRLYGVTLKSDTLSSVRKVLEEAMAHVQHGTPDKVESYGKCVGRHEWRRKLFFAAVKEYQSRLGLPSREVQERREVKAEIPPPLAAPVVPVAEPAPPAPPSQDQERQDAGSPSPGPDGGRRAAGGGGFAFHAPQPAGGQQLQFEILSEDDIPDFMKKEVMQAPAQSWTGVFQGQALSEREEMIDRPEVGHAEALPDPLPSASKPAPADAEPPPPKAKPSNVMPFKPRQHGHGFNVRIGGKIKDTE